METTYLWCSYLRGTQIGFLQGNISEMYNSGRIDTWSGKYQPPKLATLQDKQPLSRL